MANVVLYDTTLRDGTQGRGMSISLEDKLEIAGLLDQMGMDYIEGGWPASNPKDTAFFVKMAPRIHHAKLTAFGSTRKKSVRTEEDANLNAILDLEVPAATLFGKASVFQVERILETDRSQNLKMVEESVRYLVRHGLEVIFDAEHFFDGFREDPSYALEVLDAAQEGGASYLVLCDTNGGSLPKLIVEGMREAVAHCQVKLGIHAHNDSGLGVANSLAAVEAGASMVQGTMNGYGERCGNANLCTIWPNLVWKMGYEAGFVDLLPELTRTSRKIAEIANLAPDPNAPYVGENAFAHKAGVHAGAVAKIPQAYEHIDPAQVGQHRQILVSELAGRSNLAYHFEELAGTPDMARAVIEQVKLLEARGYQFEDAEESMRLMVQRALNGIPQYFQVERFHVSVTHDDQSICEATVRISVGHDRRVEVGEGDGPVHALDRAIRKALAESYPELNELKLTDYKVRVLDGRDATAAMTRVWIASEYQGRAIQTVGVSRNILEASWDALLDAIHYVLWSRHIETRHHVAHTTSA